MKQLLLYLLTTSAAKRAHISYLLSRHSVSVADWRAFGGYPELQSDNSLESLRFGVEYLRSRFARPFIIEDTEVKIDAYSPNPQVSYPGFDVKRWWQVFAFEEIDSKCRQAGTRTVSQTSTVCLSVPGLKPFFFRNTVRGEIAYERKADVETAQAPWLNAKDFGSIFIPEGADRAFGNMDLAESLRFDFRKPAIDRLVKKVDEITAILNLDSSCYSSEATKTNVASSFQLPLFRSYDLNDPEEGEECS